MYSAVCGFFWDETCDEGQGKASGETGKGPVAGAKGEKEVKKGRA
jgi:hypothetical protein